MVKTVVGISFLFSSQVAPAISESPLANQYQEAKAKLLSVEQAERKMLGTLYLINERMKDMSKRRDRLTDRLFAVQGDIQLLTKSIASLERKTEEQRMGLSRRVRALYMLHGQGAMRILFSAQNSQDLDRNLKFLKLITDRDYRLIKQYEKSLKALRRQRQRLDIEVGRMARIQSAIKKQETLLAKEQSAKSGLLDKIKTSQSRHLDELKRIRSQAFDGSEVNMTGLSQAFFEAKGSLPSPVSGELRRGFGVLQDEEYRYRLSHKGLFFGASMGDEVRSVFPGEVQFAGELPWQGWVVVVDHGDHYYTVYTHLVQLAVRAGSRIEAGQLIGQAGGLSLLLGEGLYFEIRHFSEAIDPRPWLKEYAEMKTTQL